MADIGRLDDVTSDPLPVVAATIGVYIYWGALWVLARIGRRRSEPTG